MKKKGFTLIELLAVIALIGLVALTITPIAIKVFNSSQKKMVLLTAEKLWDSTENYLRDYQLETGKVITNTTVEIVNGQIVNNKFTISGRLPESGFIYVNSDSMVALAIYDHGTCAFKDYDWTEAKLFDVSESDCKNFLSGNDIYAPVIAVEKNTVDVNTSEMIITFSDKGSSGLDENNKYEYYLSTSNNQLVGGSWNPYTNGTRIVIDESTPNSYYLWVYPIKDKSGNISGNSPDTNTPYVIAQYHFDTEKPILTVNSSSGTYEENGTVTITVSDNEGGSGLSSTNVYKYCLSTSNTTRENCEWTSYTSGTSFAISGKDQTRYLWVWPIQDNAGNINGDHINVNTPYVAGIYKFISTYTITYNLNGGTATNNTSYNMETETFTLNNPTRENYTFAGWTGGNGIIPSTSVSITKGSTGNKTYIANWTPIDYTITYNLNGGTATNNTSYNIETETFTLNNPTRTGYTFTGWTDTQESLLKSAASVGFSEVGNQLIMTAAGTEGNIHNAVKMQIWTVDGEKIFDGYQYKQIVTSSGLGLKTATYTHQHKTDTYYLRLGANGNKRDSTLTYYVRLVEGMTYHIEWNTTYFASEKIIVENLKFYRDGGSTVGIPVDTIVKGSYGNRTLTANWSQPN